MSGSDFEDNDRPLTPEQQQVLNRARMLFAGVMMLLILGFIIIGGLVVYRMSQHPAAPAAPAAAAAGPVKADAIRLPSGAEVISVVAGEGSITATYRVGPSIQVRVFDAATGEMQHQFDVLTSAP
jgi:hypothetical protein